MANTFLDPTPGERNFIASLKKLAGYPKKEQNSKPERNPKLEDRGALAALRRGVGKAPGEAAEMYPYVAWALSETGDRPHDDDFFTVAALFASHYDQIWEEDQSHLRNFGVSFRALWIRREQAPGIEGRFVGLLGASREQLPHHLRAAISLMKAGDIPVCWEYLLRDLGKWGYASRTVQRAWARAFWGHSAPDATTASATTTTGE